MSKECCKNYHLLFFKNIKMMFFRIDLCKCIIHVYHLAKYNETIFLENFIMQIKHAICNDNVTLDICITFGFTRDQRRSSCKEKEKLQAKLL